MGKTKPTLYNVFKFELISLLIIVFMSFKHKFRWKSVTNIAVFQLRGTILTTLRVWN